MKPAIPVLIAATLLSISASGQFLPNLLPLPNPAGFLENYNSKGGPINLTGAFFQSLGTNGRTCASCHRPAQGMGISADEVKARFDSTQGLDPIFRTNDGSNCDHNIDTSTIDGRRKAYSLLTGKGLIRVTIPPPAGAEFSIISVVNKYGCSELSPISFYRRPLPTTNLRFLSVVMWDGRESTAPSTQKVVDDAALLFDLRHQATDATTGHAQGVAPTAAQIEDIVNFEMSIASAQAIDRKAGFLNARGAKGGPLALAAQLFYIGINDPLGLNPRGTPFTSKIFDLYDAWAVPSSQDDDDREKDDDSSTRAQIARGQALFNNKPINITGVAGLNDDLGVATIAGKCGTCHDSPNVGDHSFAAPLNIGVGDLNSPLDVSYLPVIQVRNNTTGEIKTTTDVGRAMITGKWKDLGRMKGPVLRGLASRAPYFHNGSADTLGEVIDFYYKRFNAAFTVQEKKDIVAFLNTL